MIQNPHMCTKRQLINAIERIDREKGANGQYGNGSLEKYKKQKLIQILKNLERVK
jgi:hypothetical protein